VDTTSLILSNYNIHEFNNITAAYENPYYKISTLPIKQRRKRKNNAL